MTPEQWFTLGLLPGFIVGGIFALSHITRRYRLGVAHGIDLEKMRARHQREADENACKLAMLRIKMIVLDGRRMALNGEKEP